MIGVAMGRGERRLALALILLAASMLAGCESPPQREGDPLRVLAYNTYYVFSHGTEVEAGSAWIAGQRPDVVALQELTNIPETRLAELAAGWGHSESALLKTSGFSVGLTSTQPIETIERVIDGLHHGCLHARVADIHVFVIHLSPFRWEVRTREAEILLTRIEPLLECGEDVLVLGDFNAVSADDLALLDAQPELLAKERERDATHDHVENLRAGAFDTSVMQAFLDAGLVDVALPFVAPSRDGRSTFTTGIWTDEKVDPPAGGTRIDFILASPSLAAKTASACIVRQGDVNRISDHYPVIATFER